MSLHVKRSTWNVRLLIWPGFMILLAWGLYKIPLQSIWQTLTGIGLPALVALALANIALLLLFSSRWWLILRAQGYAVPYLPLVGYRLAGFSMSYFTPGPQFGGEPLQVYLSGRHHHLPNSVAIAAVALDKLLELLVNFTFLVTGIAITIQSGLLGELAVGQVLGLAVTLLALPVSYLLALWAGWQPFTQLSRRVHVLAVKPMFQALVSAETQASQFCRQRPGVILLALTLSLVIWAGMILEYWLMLYFLDLPISLTHAITALTAARLAFLAPTPGGLGALEASQVFALQALGFSPAQGISAALLIRARDLALGGLGLCWLGMLPRTPSPVPVLVEASD